VIAAGNTIEPTRLIGNDARENVEPSGRAFWIGRRRNVSGQSEALDQRHDINASGLQHGTVDEGEFVELQIGDALRDRGARAGQKTRTHPIGDRAEAQIETRRLNLICRERIARMNPARLRQRRDHAVGKNALIRGFECGRHGKRSNPTPGLTQRQSRRIHPLIPWSFEPAGLQAT
jgi:hypothetical protein